MNPTVKDKINEILSNEKPLGLQRFLLFVSYLVLIYLVFFNMEITVLFSKVASIFQNDNPPAIKYLFNISNSQTFEFLEFFITLIVFYILFFTFYLFFSALLQLSLIILYIIYFISFFDIIVRIWIILTLFVLLYKLMEKISRDYNLTSMTEINSSLRKIRRFSVNPKIVGKISAFITFIVLIAYNDFLINYLILDPATIVSKESIIRAMTGAIVSGSILIFCCFFVIFFVVYAIVPITLFILDFPIVYLHAIAYVTVILHATKKYLLTKIRTGFNVVNPQKTNTFLNMLEFAIISAPFVVISITFYHVTISLYEVDFYIDAVIFFSILFSYFTIHRLYKNGFEIGGDLMDIVF